MNQVTNLQFWMWNTKSVFWFETFWEDFQRNPSLRKNVQIRRFFWSVFSRIWTEYRDLSNKSLYSVQIREIMDQKKRRIWTLSIQWLLHWEKPFTHQKQWFLLEILTHFRLIFHFYTPWKSQKTKGFLTFSWGIEIIYWPEMV